MIKYKRQNSFKGDYVFIIWEMGNGQHETLNIDDNKRIYYLSHMQNNNKPLFCNFY